MSAACDLVMAEASVAGVASPDACLDPAVQAIARERSPLIVACAASATAVERSATTSVGAVDFVRAEILGALRHAPVHRGSPRRIAVAIRSISRHPVAREYCRKDWRRIPSADGAAENVRHEAVAVAVHPPGRIAVDAVGDLVVAEAGVGGGAGPHANLHPHVASVARRRPLITGLCAAEWR